MSTVKITDLPAITTINSNTANTVLVGVDIPTNITGKITLTTLAAGLYSNNNLVVGNNYTVLPNVVGQFTGNSTTYIQVNIENQTSSGSGDFVATADDGTDTDHYIDMGINGSTYSDPTYSAVKAHDGYLYVASSGTGKGNLAIGSTNSTGRVNFVVGGLETSNIVGYVDSTGIWSNSINSVVTANAASANSVINTRVSANVATLRSEITGNVTALNGSITSNISTQNTFTQAAFDKANTGLANTNGVITAGALTVSGNLITNTALRVNNASIPGNTQYLVITGTETGNIGTPTNAGYTFHSAVDSGNRVVAEAYSNTASDYASFIGRRARGTAANPLPVQSGDIIARFGGNGFGLTKFSQFSDGRVEVVATENHTDIARGTKIRFINTIDGTNVATEIATFNANTATFTGVVNPTKGFIYTPRVLAGAQTAITVDYSSDSIIRANLSSDLTVSHSNFTAGKVVEVWLLNTSGFTRTITHGVSAQNSTLNSTTFTMASTSSAYMKFFSIDGDLANTFVTVQHA